MCSKGRSSFSEMARAGKRVLNYISIKIFMGKAGDQMRIHILVFSMKGGEILEI
jgi:hypothetical protein